MKFGNLLPSNRTADSDAVEPQQHDEDTSLAPKTPLSRPLVNSKFRGDSK